MLEVQCKSVREQNIIRQEFHSHMTRERERERKRERERERERERIPFSNHLTLHQTNVG